MRKKRTNTIPKVLVYLTYKRNKNKWEITNDLKKSYANILKTSKKLLEEKLIRVVETRKAEKNPKIEVEYYELTRLGLMLALAQEESWIHIDAIAENYPEMQPLIFGKWAFFVERGIRDIIVARLQAAILAFSIQQGKEWYRIVAGIPQEKIKVLIEKKGKERAERILWRHKQVVGNLTNSVLGFNLYLHPKDESERIKEEIHVLRILMEDPEIREYLHKEIVFWEEQKKQIYENVHAWREWFESLG